MANLQVLVVDDDEVIRLLCADLLSDMGYEVTCAADGQEAVSHLKRAVFDLVLLDLDLPLLRGQEVLQIMRTELASEALVIIMSAWISEDTRRFGEKYGVLAYLEKPFDLVINATAASLGGEAPPLPDAVLANDAAAYDLMYASEPTPFMRWASRLTSGPVVDGLGMLVEQAAESFLLWRGVRPDTAPVIQALR